jgi:4-carboxymuconolactone decarboxylase
MTQDDLRRQGQEMYRRLFGRERGDPETAFDEVTLEHLFAKVWTREGLSTRDRSLITVSILAATARENELRTHLKGLANQGFGPREIVEVMIHVAHYAGWPAGNTGLRVARELGLLS